MHFDPSVLGYITSVKGAEVRAGWKDGALTDVFPTEHGASRPRRSDMRLSCLFPESCLFAAVGHELVVDGGLESVGRRALVVPPPAVIDQLPTKESVVFCFPMLTVSRASPAS